MEKPRARRVTICCILLSLVLLGMPASMRAHIRLSLLSPLRPLSHASGEVAQQTQTLLGGFLQDGTETRTVTEDELQILNGQLARMKSEVADLRKTLAAWKVVVRQGMNLTNVNAVAAPVILSHDPSTWRDSMLLAAGSADGVRTGQPVVWDQHLIGRVVNCSKYLSQVQLVTDPGFSTPALPLPVFDLLKDDVPNREVGLFSGTGGNEGTLKWISRNSEMEQGWFILTAGDPLSGIPRGLIVGKVRECGLSGFYYHVDVQPILRHNHLERVFILQTEPVSMPEEN
jgi:cell shape-determining protein MreC